MIGLDTNVVVRFLVQDDPVQAKIATRIFEHEIGPANPGLISSVVLCEVVWVVQRAYKQKKAKIVEIVRLLLETESVSLEHRDAVWRALRQYESGKADFPDCLIAEINKELGAATTVTFDVAAAGHALFSLAGNG